MGDGRLEARAGANVRAQRLFPVGDSGARLPVSMSAKPRTQRLGHRRPNGARGRQFDCRLSKI